METKMFLEEIKSIISDFGFFEEKIGPNKEIILTLYYPEKELEIAIWLPLSKNGSLVLIKGRSIGFTIRRNGEVLVRLRKSLAGGKNWKTLTKYKVRALEDLINDIPRCPRDEGKPFPKVEKAIQANPKGTKFVIYQCPTCHNNITSQFGTGIKTRTHSLLPKD